MSFTHHSTRVQFEDALIRMQNSPNHHLMVAIAESLKVELKQVFPYNTFQLYSYETPSATYWFGQRNFDVVKPFTHFAVDGTIVDSEFVSAFKSFDEVEKLSDERPKLLLAAGIELKEKALKLIGPPKGGNDAYRFYMTEKQRTQLLETDLTVPEGYKLGSATIDDAKFITNNWQFAGPGDDVQTRRKIECFPSSCVRYNGQVIAYEISDYAGMLNNQYTVPAHRGKGLGKLVELDLSKKLISEGYAIYKHVDCNNPIAVPYTERSKFFTRSENSDGSPAIVSYIDL